MNLINVIIPAYNCENTLRQTITSIQNSGLNDFSIIIIDDGSTDGTSNICRNLENEYDNIHCFYQPNAGVSAARNQGIEMSDSTYLLFFDADDTINENALAEVQKILMRYQPDMLIFGMCFDYYYKGKCYRTEKMCYNEEALYSKSGLQEHFAELYQCNALNSSCNKIIRRGLIIENQIRYEEKMFLLEDFLFTLDCLDQCETIYTFPKAIYRYRQSEDEGNVYRRMNRISNLQQFTDPFRCRLEKHADVFSKMYFMLLHQKVWKAHIKEMPKIAEDCLLSDVEPVSLEDNKFYEDLSKGKYLKIRVKNLLAQFRHKIAIRVKTYLFPKKEE